MDCTTVLLCISLPSQIPSAPRETLQSLARSGVAGLPLINRGGLQCLCPECETVRMGPAAARRQRIACVGSGITGLSTAWVLQR
jgi:hypothetical protein